MSAGTAIIAERKQQGRWLTALLLAPSAIWFFLLLILPLIVVVVYSVGVRAPASRQIKVPSGARVSVLRNAAQRAGRFR